MMRASQGYRADQQDNQGTSLGHLKDTGQITVDLYIVVSLLCGGGGRSAASVGVAGRLL